MHEGNVQDVLRPYAIASLLLYVIGIPAVFAVILFRHRRFIASDQRAYMAITNIDRYSASGRMPPPPILRRRYGSLYLLFRPGMAFWRVVVVVRKLLIVAVAILLNSYPMFQAWYVH